MFDTMTLSLATVFAGMLLFPLFLRARKLSRRRRVTVDSSASGAPGPTSTERQWAPEIPERRAGDRRAADRRVANLPLPPGQPDRRKGDRRQAERRHLQTALLDRERRAVARASSPVESGQQREALIQRLDEDARRKLAIERVLAGSRSTDTP